MKKTADHCVIPFADSCVNESNEQLVVVSKLFHDRQRLYICHRKPTFSVIYVQCFKASVITKLIKTVSGTPVNGSVDRLPQWLG